MFLPINPAEKPVALCDLILRDDVGTKAKKKTPFYRKVFSFFAGKSNSE